MLLLDPYHKIGHKIGDLPLASPTGKTLSRGKRAGRKTEVLCTYDNQTGRPGLSRFSCLRAPGTVSFFFLRAEMRLNFPPRARYIFLRSTQLLTGGDSISVNRCRYGALGVLRQHTCQH